MLRKGNETAREELFSLDFVKYFAIKQMLDTNRPYGWTARANLS